MLFRSNRVRIEELVGDAVEAVVGESMPMKTLSRTVKTRRRSEFARLGNVSGTKALPVLPVPGMRGARTIMNLSPCQRD